MAILRVLPADLAALWPQVEPLVVAALRGSPTHDAEDVRSNLLAGQSSLFIQYAGSKVEAVAICNFSCYPKGIWLRIWLVASCPEIPLDGPGFYQIIERWRIAHGCRGFEVLGARRGWLNRIDGAELQAEGWSFRSTKS